MMLKSGFFRSLLMTSWWVNCRKDSIAYSLGRGGTETIDYFNLGPMTYRDGLMGGDLTIVSTAQKITFEGVSDDEATRWINTAKRYASEAIAALLNSEVDKLVLASHALNTLKSGNFYLNQSKVDEVREILPDSVRYFEHRYFDESLLDSRIRQLAKEYKDFINPLSQGTTVRNEMYIAKKKAEYRDIFDQIEKHPLTDEQRTAVVTEEDNILLIAAAGSGKTSTIKAKLLYLLKEGQYRADQIITFAYNKDAQLELTSRIDALFNQFNWEGERAPAKTFHGFCMDVLAQVHSEKPSISTVATASRANQLRYFIELVERIRAKEPKFTADLLTYFAVFKHPAPREGAIKNQFDYNQYLLSLNGSGTYDQKTNTWTVRLIAMDGTEVKSHEELRIVNWLVLNGINYKYEYKYVINTADQQHRQYYPDFYYPDAELWHEHFALDANGKAPEFLKRYEDGVRWKRALHEAQQTKLFETTSAQFSDDSVFDVLDKAMTSENIPRNPPPQQALDAMIEKAFNPERDLDLVITFLKHFKTNNLSMEELEQRVNAYDDKGRAKAFMRVLVPVYQAYQQDLADQDEIDFEDLIHNACREIETGNYKSPFEYVMIDEFQDASQDRLRLIKALTKQKRHCKLFCVGDDWQSIYRFSGADLKVMTGFPNIFGFTKQLKLTHTFRSYQQIVDVASNFIQKNPDQFPKEVKTQAATDRDPVILRPYDPSRPDKSIEELMSSLCAVATKQNCRLSVFILTRYIAHKPKNLALLQQRFTNLDIDWKTVHASKGLEADYVVIHHLNSGSYGFPSEIADDPLLDLVIPEPETYPHAEERRLLYVAITRAKRAAFGTYNPNSPSEFVKELSEIDGVKVFDRRFENAYAADDICPKCETGTLWLKDTGHDSELICSTPDCDFASEMRCPECKVGQIVKKTARQTGRHFYACDQFPKCRHIYKERKPRYLGA